MKILMIPTWYSAHDADVMTAGVFHYEQSIALQKYAEMALYFPYDMGLDAGFYRAEEKGLLTFRRGKRLSFLRPIFFILDFLRIRKEFNPDIIHGHVGAGAGVPAILLGKLFRIPVVITEHNPIELMGFADKKRVDYVRNVYSRSAANICVSNHSMNSLLEYFPEEKFQVIYNGVIDPQTIENDGKKYAIDGPVNCCIVAAFYDKEIKGYQYLIPAIKKLVDADMDITLHICGGGDHMEYYQNLAKELGVEENCIFYGQCNRQKVYSIVSQMDFSISASLFECSGVSVQEAMLLGKPLLVTKSGGANSLVTVDTAIVVDKGSVDALAEGIREMVERLPEFKEARIREYAFKNFEIDQVSKKYMELYTALIEKQEN